MNKSKDELNFIAGVLAEGMMRAFINEWQLLPTARDLCDTYEVDFRLVMPMALGRISDEALYQAAVEFAKGCDA